ncbi:aldo/keto reductase [Microbacterium sp. GXF0217]
MKYVKLGSTGLDVSAIALGCMSYGDASRGGHQWVLNEEDSRPLFAAALDAGINFFDSANVYSGGSSEEFLGRALRELGANRDAVVVATKVHGTMHDGPNGAGLSRKAILQEVDNSLRRLQTDYIDLYQVHRWDSSTPIEETLEALNDVVKAGKVRYLGASSMYAWQFSKALYLQRLHGWSSFVSMQDHYNLINREFEREMAGLCADQGIGVVPWSPLARGKLTRDWGAQSARSESDSISGRLYAQTESADRNVADVVAAVGAELEVPRAQVALSWLLSKPSAVPLVGATKLSHLSDAVAATRLELSAEIVARLEDPYVPHAYIV